MHIHEEINIDHGKLKKFRALIKRSGLLVTLVAQIMGFYPFSRDLHNKLIFHWLSFPVVIAVFHTSIITGMVIQYLILVSQEKNANVVDQIGSALGFCSTLICGLCIRVIGIALKGRMVDLWSKLVPLLETIYQTGTESSQIHFESKLKKLIRKLDIVYLLVWTLFGIFLIQTIRELWNAKALVLLSVLANIFITGYVFLFISITMCFVHIIELITISFSVLRIQQTYSTIPEIVFKIPQKPLIAIKLSANCTELFYKHFYALEAILRSMNEKFWPELIIIVCHNGIMLVSAIYVGWSLLSTTGYSVLINVVPVLTVSFLNLLLLCNSSAFVTKEVSFRYHFT